MASESYLGCIYMFAGNFAPKGYQICAGQLLSIAQNTALFSLLGTTYGGDGRVTFALPDLRGRAAIGAGQGPGLDLYQLGESTGSPSVTLLNTNLPMHNHSIQASQSSDSTSPAGTFLGNDGRNPSPIYNSRSDGTTMNPLATSVAGGSQPVAVQNPVTTINFIIATQGLFPSRN